jgi:hypothetical protein
MSDLVILWKVRKRARKEFHDVTYVWYNSSFSKKFDDNLPESPQVVNPLNEPTLLVQGNDGVGFDI